MFSGLPCETHIAHIAHIARNRGEWMFSGLPCETHIAHIARIARTRGTVRVHFAWFLYGFCMVFAWFLTRQATEHPLSPGSLLYVLYVLYGPI